MEKEGLEILDDTLSDILQRLDEINNILKAPLYLIDDEILKRDFARIDEELSDAMYQISITKRDISDREIDIFREEISSDGTV